MIAAVCLGFFGTVFALVGMKCTKIGGTDKNKAKIACFAGVNFILSGKCAGTIRSDLCDNILCILKAFSSSTQASAHCQRAPCMHTA